MSDDLFLKAALQYWRMGLSVIPLKPKSKAALIPWEEFQSRLPTEDEIRGWWSKTPNANVAIVLGPVSGMIALEVDDKTALNGKPIPLTPQAISGGKRLPHIYLKSPSVKFKNFKEHKNRKELFSIRGTRQYIVAPPSVHPSGNRYAWASGLSIHQVKLADPPEWVLKLISDNSNKGGTKSTQVRSENEPQLDNEQLINVLLPYWKEKGQRQNMALYLAGFLAKVGVSWADTEQTVMALAKRSGDDETRQRLAAIKTTFEKAKRGDPVKGFTGLEEVMKPDDLKELTGLFKPPQSSNTTTRYFVNDAGLLCRHKQIKEGSVPVPLSNFDARIEEEVLEDNGVEVSHRYAIGCEIKGRKFSNVEIPASSFSSMNWICKWGSEAVLEPGQNIKDYVRHAIQSRSKPNKVTAYTHTGFRKINDQWVYLTAGGCIGDNNVTVRLPEELNRYALPTILKNESEAIQTSLSFLELADSKITIPLLALTYLAPMTSLLKPQPNTSGYIYGETGLFKTTMALLMLSHYGDFSSIEKLPNFEDTPNALVKQAFVLKDTLMVVDDYHPSTQRYDAQRKESIAQRLVRSFANRTDRARLNPDSTEKPRYEPRGMLLITGEELTTLQSTLARLFVVEIKEGDIDLKKLTELQSKVEFLSSAMVFFINWLRGNIGEVQENFPEQFAQLRQKIFNASLKENTKLHPKICESAAFLQFSLNTVLSWAKDRQAITEKEAKEGAGKSWEALTELAKQHNKRLSEEDPVNKFFDVINTLITQGKVRINSKDESSPFMGGVDGELIGFHDDDSFYFLSQALWHALQRHFITGGDYFPLRKNTLYRILSTRGLIETRKGENTFNTKVGSKQYRVLQIYKRYICGNSVTSETDEEKQAATDT